MTRRNKYGRRLFKWLLPALLAVAAWSPSCAASGTDVYIDIVVIGEGTTFPPEGENLFYQGNTVGLNATPAAGWHFNRWICGDSDFVIEDPNSPTTTVSLPIIRNFQITAVFTFDEDLEPVATIENPRSDVTIQAGESVNFQGSASDGNPPYTYLWHFGGGVSDSMEEDPGSQYFNRDGVFTVTMTAYDDDGDSDTDTVTVTVGNSGSGGGGGGGCFLETLND